MATAVASHAERFARGSRLSKKTANDLVPESPSDTPNYWCTWAAQNYMYGHDLPELDPKVLEGDSGSKLAHDAMTEKILLEEQDGHRLLSRIREDVLFLLDDGWQIGGTATFELDPKSFPPLPDLLPTGS